MSFHSSSTTSENLPPRTIARLIREVRDLVQIKSDQAVEGIRLIVDLETGLPSNLGELSAELEGPVGTPYEGKFFHFKLIFCQQYPAVAPRGFFLTKIYHPNVDISTGAICVNTLKKDWTSSTTLSHILNVIRCLLIVPFPESSLNDEAGKLFMESYSEYYKRAKLMADVHGRTTSYFIAQQQQSVAAENNDSGRSNTSLDKSSRILKSSSSDNPLRPSSNTQNSNTNSNTSKNNSTPSANKKLLCEAKK